jgi:ankyrin repeat protein
MSSKNYTFLLFLISLVPILIGVDRLSSSLSREDVYQATDAYVLSGHADKESASFTHWDDDDPPVIPANCAKCHSTAGFLDFLGENGSPFGTVDQDVNTGEVITCIACHNPSAHRLTQVPFHSGVEVQPVSTEAVCLVCHQSRQSTPGIQEALDGLEEDQVSSELSFINPHYNFAASTQFGSAAHSGYEYPSLEYDGYFFHAANASTCTDCHNAHSLRVDPQKCAVCHVNVVSEADFRAIRMQTTDYDGNSDTC